MPNDRKVSLISETDVRHVAELAKIRLQKKEIDKFRKQLASIFEYVNQIGLLKTEGIAESTQVGGITNRFREDKVDKTRMLTQEEALSNAKKQHHGYFLVKAIFE